MLFDMFRRVPLRYRIRSVILYISLLWIAKEVQLFPVLGVYSGIFAIYLQYPSNESRTRTANVIFYTICLLYVFCAAAVVNDSISFTFEVSNKFICKNIIFIISCAVLYQFTITSTSNWLTANNKSYCGCPIHIYYLLWLHLPMHHSTQKPINSMLYPSSVLLT